MSIYEYNEEEHMNMVYADGHEDGREEGLTQGLAQGLTQGEIKKSIKLIIKKSANDLDATTISENIDEPIDFVEKICALIQGHPSADSEELLSLFLSIRDNTPTHTQPI